MTVEQHPMRSEDDASLLRLVNRIVTIFAWSIAALILLTIVGAVLSVLAAFYGANDSTAATIGRELMSSFPNIVKEIWAFLRPILQLVVIVFLIRLLLGGEGFRGRMGPLLADVPSVIAVVVVGTVCVLPLLTMTIPDALSNIALVIVGFYFGRRQGRAETPEERDQTT